MEGLHMVKDLSKIASGVPGWVWIAAAAGVVLYVSKKGVSGVTQDVTAGAVGAVGDVAAGIVSGIGVGIGDIVGIPRTSISKCQTAIRNADDLAASAHCDAATFSRWQYLSMRKRLTGKDFTMSDVFN